MGLTPEQIAVFPLWYVAFLLSVTCHEAAHALVAKWGGDLTAYNTGQVSLNPMPLIRREPWGTVLVPVLTFFLSGSMLGWGSAPYDPRWEQRHPKRAALMALAGPAANFLLAIAMIVVIHAGRALGVFQAMGSAGERFGGATVGGAAAGVQQFLFILFYLNVLLGSFNLLPVSPLDGHSAIGLLLPEDMFLRWLAFIRSPMASLLGLLLAWKFFGFLFDPIFSVALSLL